MLRKTGIIFTLLLLIARCGQIPELLTFVFGRNFYVLYLLTVPVLVALILAGELQRCFRFWPTYFWLAFAVWMTAAIPFSIWKGGSAQIIVDYWRTDLILLLGLGGLFRTWKECRWIFWALTVSFVFNLALIHFWGKIDDQGRLGLQFGAFANSNDYAAHLFMLLSSAVWVGLAAKRLAVRLGVLSLCGYGVYLILASASRGALVALVVGIVFSIVSLSGKWRVVALVGTVGAALLAFTLLSSQVVNRILSFSDGTGTASQEALESSGIRSQLLEDSIAYAFENPLFGLGPGNFRTAEGQAKPGLWQPTHNSYVAVASECGIPAFLFFLGGVCSSFLLFRELAITDDLPTDLRRAGWCMQLTMLTFCTAIGFLNFSYSMHLPIILGVSVAMGHAALNVRNAIPQVGELKEEWGATLLASGQMH